MLDVTVADSLVVGGVGCRRALQEVSRFLISSLHVRGAWMNVSRQRVTATGQIAPR